MGSPHQCQNPVVSSLLPPINEVCEGYVFIPVCHSVHGDGAWQGGAWQRACMAGEHMWQGAYMAGEGMHGRGAYVAGGIHGRGGHAWQGGVHGKGAMHGGRHVWQGSMHGRGHAWWGCVWQGACMADACVAGGHAWQGGMHGGGVHGRGTCVAGENAWQGGMCGGGVHGGGMHGEGCMAGGRAWYMVNEREVRIPLECILVYEYFLLEIKVKEVFELRKTRCSKFVRYAK